MANTNMAIPRGPVCHFFMVVDTKLNYESGQSERK